VALFDRMRTPTVTAVVNEELKRKAKERELTFIDLNKEAEAIERKVG